MMQNPGCNIRRTGRGPPSPCLPRGLVPERWDVWPHGRYPGHASRRYAHRANPLDDNAAVPDPREPPPLPVANTYTPLHHPQEIAFTDGSAPSKNAPAHLPGVSSAAVWWDDPTLPMGGHVRLAIPPEPGAPVVNRAEIAAILWALRNTRQRIIATDSLAAMHQIRGYLMFPRKVLAAPPVPLPQGGGGRYHGPPEGRRLHDIHEGPCARRGTGQ
jgi:hypothetical protein